MQIHCMYIFVLILSLFIYFNINLIQLQMLYLNTFDGFLDSTKMYNLNTCEE